MKRTICVDMDGVLATYDGWKGHEHFGDPIPGARAFLAKLSEVYEVAIYTTRCNAEVNKTHSEEELIKLVQDWLDEHNMYYDKIIPKKPICVAFVDDNAIRCEPQKEVLAFENVLQTLFGEVS